MTIRRLAVSAALAVLAAGLSTVSVLARSTTLPATISVSPRSGSDTTRFVVRFAAAAAAAGRASGQRAYRVDVTAGTSAAGCITHASVHVVSRHAGGRATVTLDPGRLGGRWCTGTFRGRVAARGARTRHFTFVVRSPGTTSTPQGTTTTGGTTTPTNGDTIPPTFGGITSAFACTPGPQRPGQTTPYTLSWTAASDDRTPSSQIVYDVYLASTAGAEDFSTPTWTTPPGVTSFRTPGLPSHGTAYFVVRARDQAGNEDGNTVERRGIDPCY
jgi:hypothetical protein